MPKKQERERVFGKLQKTETLLPNAREQGQGQSHPSPVGLSLHETGTVAFHEEDPGSSCPVIRRGNEPGWGLQTELRNATFLGRAQETFLPPPQLGECPGQGPLPGTQARACEPRH